MTNSQQRQERDIHRAAAAKKGKKMGQMFADNIRTMPVNDKYEEGFENIFGKRDIHNKPVEEKNEDN